MPGENDLPLRRTGWKAQVGTGWGYHGDRDTHFVKMSAYKYNRHVWQRKSSYAFIRVRNRAAPHLKLLSELKVDIIHLGNGNIVVLSLFLVQQLVPDSKESREMFVEMCKNWVHLLFSFQNTSQSLFDRVPVFRWSCLQTCSVSGKHLVTWNTQDFHKTLCRPVEN